MWRMTAEGCLVHVASSTTNTNYVLDLYEPLPKGHYHNNKVIPLVVTKMRSSKAESQTWVLMPVSSRYYTFMMPMYHMPTIVSVPVYLSVPS